MLTIVHRVISTFLIKRSGRAVKSGAQSGAVTLIQRFGSALNLNLHFHMLYLGGVYDKKGYFWPVKPPTKEDLDYITHVIAKRVSRFLEREGYLYRDAESEYLDLVPDEEDAMQGILGASITYRLAFGPNAGRKALTLQAIPGSDSRQQSSELVSKQSGFLCMMVGPTHRLPVNPIKGRSLSACAGMSRDPRLRSDGYSWHAMAM